ncbi:MAG TPA: iron-sulfur cluster-binding domain-containing protein, partial [Solirubrobacteraceae bacterium]|nr:iron-sulfur cluster-binding domain-containing protein [Solirubrobacteraceae bacterium]
RLGVEVNGRHHWRAYSLTSPPGRSDGCIAITPKLVPEGVVSPYLCQRLKPGVVVRLGGVEGTFTLPEILPARLLFLSAGSGITPIASMVRELAAESAPHAPAAVTDVVHVHCSRTIDRMAFAAELYGLAARNSGYDLKTWISGERGRLRTWDLDPLCPDWRERETYLCGPPELLEAFAEHWRREAIAERLHVEHFQPASQPAADELGGGGTISFRASGVEALSDGRQPILVAGEAAGATLPHGCRMGICHSCVGRLRAGRVRDLRTGEVSGGEGELVRTCVNAPEGPIEIEL